VNKAQLVDALATRFDGDKKTAAAAVEAVVDTVVRTVSKGEKVSITGFGVFEKRVRAARTARNPATGATVKLKKTSVPAFRAGQNFKDVVSGSKKLAKVAPAKKTAAAKTTTVRKTAAAKTTAAKTTATKAATKTAAAKKTTATKRAPARKTATKRTAKR
jgi:DNA-binding protein HU-beta